MKIKPQSTLHHRSRYLVGLSLSLAFVLMAFEWKTSKIDKIIPHPEPEFSDEIIDIPETYRLDKVKKPKQPKTSIVLIEILEDYFDNQNSNDELKNKPLDDFDPSSYGMNEEDLPYEPLPFISTEIYPHYSECDGLRGQASLECSMMAIRKRVQEVFVLPDQLRDAGGTFAANMSFLVNTKGKITEVEVIESNHPLMAKASKKALLQLTPMRAGVQQSKNVSLRMSIPIVVRLRP